MIMAGHQSQAALELVAAPFDPRDFRRALGRFGTGVAVVTARCADRTRLGMTVTSFNAVSLDPPLVLFSVDRRAGSLPHLLKAGAYAVNVLAHDQEHLSNRFAKAASDKWLGVAHHHGTGEVPLIHGAIAHFECRPYADYDGGDHIILVGEIIRYAYQPEHRPLIFFGGQYQSLHHGEAQAADWPLSLHY